MHHRKFSTVYGIISPILPTFGHLFLNNSSLILPEGLPPILMSKKTTGFPLRKHSKTFGSMIDINDK